MLHHASCSTSRADMFGAVVLRVHVKIDAAVGGA
jgi:hypothetical protein